MRTNDVAGSNAAWIQWRNDATRYGAIAQLLHWIVVVLIATQFVLAKLADDLPLSPAKISVLAQHKSVGITILLLALLRLLWRWINPAPDLPATMRRSPRLAARASHFLLYLLLVMVPLLGWLMSSARNFPVSWFGAVNLPNLIAPSRPAYELLHAAHGFAAQALFAAALLHIAAALKHHFIDRDNVLRRMLPLQLGSRDAERDDIIEVAHDDR